MTPLWLAAAAAAVVVAWIIGAPWWRRRRLDRLRRGAFPAEWTGVLSRRCTFYRRLPPDLVQRLHGAVMVFLADKTFYGCDGLEVTDEMRLTIAGHACLLVAARGNSVYPWVRSVLVYPGAFLVDREHMDEAGVHSVERQVLAGESWDEGRVIISWEDVMDDARAMDGVNVVVHEFAHQLDQQSGEVNGAPVLASDHGRWARVMQEAYEELRASLDSDSADEPVIDPYGATDPGEFFAVVSEAFIETPAALARRNPGLYDLLKGYYRLDPASWADHPSSGPGGGISQVAVRSL